MATVKMVLVPLAHFPSVSDNCLFHLAAQPRVSLHPILDQLSVSDCLFYLTIISPTYFFLILEVWHTGQLQLQWPRKPPFSIWDTSGYKERSGLISSLPTISTVLMFGQTISDKISASLETAFLNVRIGPENFVFIHQYIVKVSYWLIRAEDVAGGGSGGG